MSTSFPGLAVDRDMTYDLPTQISHGTTTSSPTINTKNDTINAMSMNDDTMTATTTTTGDAKVVVVTNVASVMGKDMSQEARKARKASRLTVRTETLRIEAKRQARKLARKRSHLALNALPEKSSHSTEQTKASQRIALVDIKKVALIAPDQLKTLTPSAFAAEFRASPPKKAKQTVCIVTIRVPPLAYWECNCVHEVAYSMSKNFCRCCL